jgi:hypothetical protein
MNRSYLVQILVPKDTGKGEPVPKDWFDDLLWELNDKFGGTTSFVRSPGQGLWRNGGTTERRRGGRGGDGPEARARILGILARTA